MINKNTGKTGFTLAEVLITLGVIGVVAALTVPTLIRNYEKKAVAIRLKQAYSILSQALRLSQIDNGPISCWSYSYPASKESNKEFAEKYILPYLKNYTECPDKDSKCYVGISKLDVGYRLNNGISLGLGGALDQKVDFLYPVVFGTGGGKEKQGKNKFYFVINNKGLYPVAWKDNLTREEIFNGYEYLEANTTKTTAACNKTKCNACGVLLMLDGWEFKDDYPCF